MFRQDKFYLDERFFKNLNKIKFYFSEKTKILFTKHQIRQAKHDNSRTLVDRNKIEFPKNEAGAAKHDNSRIIVL